MFHRKGLSSFATECSRRVLRGPCCVLVCSVGPRDRANMHPLLSSHVAGESTSCALCCQSKGTKNCGKAYSHASRVSCPSFFLSVFCIVNSGVCLLSHVSDRGVGLQAPKNRYSIRTTQKKAPNMLQKPIQNSAESACFVHSSSAFASCGVWLGSTIRLHRCVASSRKQTCGLLRERLL